MPRITFKAKPYTIQNVDGSNKRLAIDVPTLTRSHCDMHAFRIHPKFGSYANSDLFPSLLRRITRIVRRSRLPRFAAERRGDRCKRLSRRCVFRRSGLALILKSKRRRVTPLMRADYVLG